MPASPKPVPIVAAPPPPVRKESLPTAPVVPPVQSDAPAVLGDALSAAMFAPRAKPQQKAPPPKPKPAPKPQIETRAQTMKRIAAEIERRKSTAPAAGFSMLSGKVR